MNAHSVDEFRYVYSDPSSLSFFEHLSRDINNEQFDTIRIIVATITSSEVDILLPALEAHLERDGESTVIIGVDIESDIEAIHALKKLAEKHETMQLQLAKAKDENTLFTTTTIWMESNSTNKIFIPADSRSHIVPKAESSTFLTGDFTSEEQRGVVRELRNLWKDMYLPETWVDLFPPTEDNLEQLKPKSDVGTSPEEPQSRVISHDVWPLQSDSRSLLMDLTGESRGTQIQPLYSVWENFFGVEADSTKLRQMKSGKVQVKYHLVNSESEERELRDVVFHNHNISVELMEYADINPEAYEQPPILIMREINPREFAYKIVSPDDEIYPDVNEMLEEQQQQEFMDRRSDRRVFISDPLDKLRVTLPN